MSKQKKSKAQRIVDFKMRSNDGFYKTKIDNCKIKYVTIHPFGDDLKLLNKINMKSKDCLSLGSYIRIHKEVYFLELISKKITDYYDVGYFVKVKKGKPSYIQILSVVNEDYITKKIFEKSIYNLLLKGIFNYKYKELIQRYNLTDKNKKI